MLKEDREFGLVRFRYRGTVLTPVTTSSDEDEPDDDDCNINTLKPDYYCLLGTGLPEVDKLIHEAAKIWIPVSTSSVRIIAMDGDTEDHISGLPNDILQYIISRLTMREGAATSILSTRWRHLWSTSVSRLLLDSPNLLGYNYPTVIKSRRWESYDENERTKFVARADHIVQFHRRDIKTDVLQVTFPLYQNSAAHIDKWIELAAAQKVNKLILDLCSRIGTKYKFPIQAFGYLNYLYLNACILEFPPNFYGLNSLVSLTLTYCVITTSDLQTILSNCPLQQLSFIGCLFPESFGYKIAGPSIQLKHLHISDWHMANIERIELQDLNLLSLELDAFESIVSIKNVPQLRRLMLYLSGPIEIPDNFPHLETLFFKHRGNELPKLSAFNNLKRLVSTVHVTKSNLFEVVYFLEACPLLEQLELDRVGHAELGPYGVGLNSKIGSRLGCAHHNLKEVHLYGFDGYSEVVELAKYLLEKATVLEKMIMYPKVRSYHGGGIFSFSYEPSKLVGMPLENVRDMLQGIARPSTEILISSSLH